jgi:hypothetical protein
MAAPKVSTLDEWLAGPARWRADRPDWIGYRSVPTPVDRVLEPALAAILGSGLTLHGGPERYYATSRSGWLGVEVDRAGLRIAVQGRIGWRIETSFTTATDGGTLITRRVYGLSAVQRRLVGIVQAFQLHTLVQALTPVT